MRRLITLVVATALTVAMLAMPASAQPVFTGGLVNVTIVDVASGNQVAVQVPIGVAANVCDVNAAVLVNEFQDDGTADCTSEADSEAEFDAIIDRLPRGAVG